MNKHAFIAITASMLFFSCSETKKETQKPHKANKNYTFSGQIQNHTPSIDSLFIKNDKNQTITSIYIDTTGSFNHQGSINSGLYTLSYGNENTSIYLEPQLDLHLTFSPSEFDETIQYKGKGEANNNYLAQKTLLREGFGDKTSYAYYGKLDEKDFLNQSDSLLNEEMNLFTRFEKGFSDKFKAVQKAELEFNHFKKLAQYQSLKRYLTGDKEFKVSKDFPNVFDNLNVNNDSLIGSNAYLDFVEYYCQKEAGKDTNKSQEYGIKYLLTLDKLVNNEKIKNKLCFRFANYRITYAKDLEQFYTEAKKLITEESDLQSVTKKYYKLKKLAKGNPSPTFAFNDINNKEVKLSDLKGKPVYIDVWATWCGPCQREIPYLKEIEKEFHSTIHFVSIAMNDNKEKWKKMVKKEKLGGFQLFAEKEESSFFDEYIVEGIPRFILLDKEGNIIDANAPRPSSGEIQSIMQKL
jgi:thiol-disulfide isomerase/thioredoxin